MDLQELKSKYVALQKRIEDEFATSAPPQELVDELQQAISDYKTAKAEAEKEANNKKIDELKENPKMNKKQLNAKLKSFLLGDKNAWMNEAGDGAAAAPQGNNGKVSADGGALIDSELQELFAIGGKGVNLVDYCTVYNVGTRAGAIPTVNFDNQEAMELVNLEECNPMEEGKVAFASTPYSLAPMGKLIPVSVQLLKEASSDILGIIGNGFGVVHKRGTNKAICAAVEAVATSAGASLAAGAAIDAIKKQVIELPAAAAEAVVVCPKSVWSVLANAKDKQDRYLLSRDANGAAIKEIEGRPVLVVENTECAAKTVLVGDLTAVAHVQVSDLEVASDASAGFNRAAVMVRALQYQQEKVVFAAAFAKLTIA